MSMDRQCGVCATRIDPYGRDGGRCERCKQPCPTCGGDVAYCHHELPEPLVEAIEERPLGGGWNRWAA